MCNAIDASGDEDSKHSFVSKISAEENDSKAAKNVEQISVDVDKMKLKQERAELVEHLYSIMKLNTSRDMKRLRKMRKSAEKDRRVRFRTFRKKVWRKGNQKKRRSFRPRKMSRTLCVTERGRKISRVNREMEYYRENQAPDDNRKKKALRNRFYDKRKKERDLNRRANGREKFENLGILREDLETDDDIVFIYDDYYTNYTVEENNIPEKFTLSEENACEELRDMIEFFLGLQDREITPEDFDFLLRLDESVPAKTLPEQRVAGLEKQAVIELHVDEVCGICMENYVVGETRKILPCKHAFHLHCIDTWLNQRSTKCPLDSGEV